MESKWSLVSLGDYCVKIGSGATPRGGSSVYKEYGEICLIRSQNIYNDGFKPQGLVYIDEDAAKKLKNVVIEKNDILLNITGDSVARVCLAVETYLPARVNQHVAIIRPNPKEFDARYLRYMISSPFMQKVLLNLASAGATRNALTKTMIETLEVSKSPLIIQKSIADCLESFDDKIFLNNQTNQTLEQMAQALFKSWFVDFDPVFDNLLASADFKLENLENRLPDELKQKAKRRLVALDSLENAVEVKASLIALAHELQAQLPTKEATQAAVSAAETPVKPNFNANPNILAQHANTHAHFPNEFEHNEQLGLIPKGWEVNQLSEITTELRRGISPKYIEEGGVQVINQKCIRNHEVNFTPCRRNNTELRKITDRELNVGDLLINSTGVGTLGRMAQVKYLDEVTVVDSHVTVVRPDSDIYPVYSFAQMMLSIEDKIEALGHGSTGQTELSRKTVSEQWVLVPKSKALNYLDSQLIRGC